MLLFDIRDIREYEHIFRDFTSSHSISNVVFRFISRVVS